MIGVEEHRQCIVEQGNKMSDPLSLRPYSRFSRIEPSVMDFPTQQSAVLSPYHARLWLEAANRPPSKYADLFGALGFTLTAAGLQFALKH